MTLGMRAPSRRGVTLIEVLFGAALISVLTIAVASMLRTAAKAIALDDHRDTVGAIRTSLDSDNTGLTKESIARSIMMAMPGAAHREALTTMDGRNVEWLIVERAGTGTAVYVGEQITGEDGDGSAQSGR